MASLVQIDGELGTTWRLDFYLDGQRKHIHIGAMNKRQATSVKTYIEKLIAWKHGVFEQEQLVQYQLQGRPRCVWSKRDQMQATQRRFQAFIVNALYRADRDKNVIR